MDSSTETADHKVTLANDGMLGSWATSSSMLMAFAALTANVNFASCSMITESFTIFLIFLGVMLESAICCRLVMALVSFAWFSCCFFNLLLKFGTSVAEEVLGMHVEGYLAFSFATV